MGRFTEVITLIGSTVTLDSVLNQIKTPVEHPVFGEEVAVFGTTYFNAALAGLRPSAMFDIWRCEYSDEEKLRHEGAVYRIIRTETLLAGKLRLTVERVGADV